jgi:hypothetical protein
MFSPAEPLPEAAIDLLASARGKRFGTILADPPWQFQNRTGKVAPEHKRLSRYGTMKLEDVHVLPVADIARLASKRAEHVGRFDHHPTNRRVQPVALPTAGCPRKGAHPEGCRQSLTRALRQRQVGRLRISEVRIDYGPGYRIYFTRRGATLLILLKGGDKSRQQEDIARARALADAWEQDHGA